MQGQVTIMMNQKIRRDLYCAEHAEHKIVCHFITIHSQPWAAACMRIA